MGRRAVMYGAGNIGRGFIGMLFAESGYTVTFVDIAKPLIDTLNQRCGYPVRTLDPNAHEDMWVSGVDAIDGLDAEAVKDAIASCDIMATAVGASILPKIADNIAEGLKERLARGGRPLNILICENLIDANELLKRLIRERMDERQQEWLAGNVGFVEASIGRMVPLQTQKLQDGDPLRVCVERYGYLPVDRNAFRGELPEIRNMVPFSPFAFFIRRKLFLHNMGHAVSAYLGLYAGRERIADAIDDPEIYILVQHAMLESAEALSLQYDVPLHAILRHMQDLLTRFGNRSLGDTCARVGADIPRKLSASDRLIGASRLCLERGVTPACICAGAAGAVYAFLREQGREQTRENAAEALTALSGALEESLCGMILRYYGALAGGCTFADLRRAAQAEKAATSRDVV